MVNKRLLPHQAALVQAPYRFPEARFFFLIAGYACVHGDTELDTPDGKVRIKDFKGGYLYAFDREAAKVVKTIALPAEELGTSPMYEVRTTDGKVIRATDKHRFLTVEGYKSINAFSSCQRILTYERNLQESTSDTYRSAQREDARHSMRTAQDFPECCSACHHQGDELPLSEEAIDPGLSPSQDDARRHSHCDLQTDDHIPSGRCSHACQQYDLLCSCRSCLPTGHLGENRALSHAACISTECISEEQKSLQQSHGNISLGHSVLTPVVPKQLSQSSTFSLRTSVVESVTYLGEFVYYDLHVPRYNNYLAEGYINHNSGKTSSLVDATLKAIQYYSGKLDNEGKPPKIGVCGITLTFLKKTFVGSLVASFRQTKSQYNYDKAHNVIYVAGVELHLTPIINEEDIYGYDWACAVVDELDELPTYTAVAVVKSINDRCRQSVKGTRPPFLVFATTSQGLKGTYQVVQSFRKKGINHVIIRARTKDNIFLPKEYVQSQYAIYNEKEKRCLLEGEFISIDSGLVYPDYDPSRNKVEYSLYETVQPNEIVYVGQDFNTGFNKAVAFVVREGILYAVKEYTFPDVRRAPEVYRYDFRENRIKWIPDATYNQHLPEFRKELRQNRIEVVYRSKNPLVKDRAFLINKLFHVERMVVGQECRDLDNALIIRQIDKNTGLPMKGKGEAAPDHVCDAAEYVAAYCTAWLKEFRDLYKVTLGRRMEKRIEAGLTTEEEEKYSEGLKEDAADVVEMR